MAADAKPARGAAIATLIAAIIGSAADDGGPDNPDNPAADPDNAPTTREDAPE